MAENLEDFLRRAAERRQQRNQQPERPQPVRPSPPPPSLQPQSDPLQPPTRPRAQPGAQPTQAATPPSRLKSSIKPRPTLAEKTEKADDQMQARLQDKFGRGVGQLDSERARKAGPVTKSPKPNLTPPQVVSDSDSNEKPLAEQVLEAFRDPQATKLAFIASEIFRPRF